MNITLLEEVPRTTNKFVIVNNGEPTGNGVNISDGDGFYRSQFPELRKGAGMRTVGSSDLAEAILKVTLSAEDMDNVRVKITGPLTCAVYLGETEICIHLDGEEIAPEDDRNASAAQ